MTARLFRFWFRTALACALAFALSCAATAAEKKAGSALKAMEHVRKPPFEHLRPGPVQIIISIDQQKLHLYSDGEHVADTPVATGVSDHPTPEGVFSVIQKSRFHLSNIYSNAPMPYMQRITWSGVAMHEGVGVGHRASHGCIRMPHDFAVRLWALTKLGAGVIIAGPELRPQPFADPHLFVHADKPAAPDPSVAPTDPGPNAPAADTAPPASAGNPATDTAISPAQATKPDATANAQGPPTIARYDAAASAPTLTAPVPDPAIPAPAAIAPAPRVSTAPISIFVSGKNKKVYVRQDFAPLFDAPVTVAEPDRRLGTHIFTALDYTDDRSSFHWDVVSLPSLRAKSATAREALARVEIPPDTIERISTLMIPGSSFIISDQGLGEETGEDTGFIVVVPAADNGMRASAHPRPISTVDRAPAAATRRPLQLVPALQ